MTPRIVAFVLLVAFAMQSFQQNLLVLDYVANMASYIESCINRDRPELKCKGKCQLMKKMQDEEKKGEQNPEHKGENKSQTLYPSTFTAYTLLPPDDLITLYRPFHVPPPVDQPRPIFHPPALL